ncbi:hypothetical protein EDD21DRAFT_386747 [Dissophora ornata]|nr:Protein OS-9 [Dissophora ornata]KAI8596969.1 hypothetical protein EDD21DRAFT_386747 [Dissophora ornata]
MRLKIVSPSQASILACATILSVSVLAPVVVSGYSVGFVYNDLLAHPQYHVQYLDEPVPMSAIGAEKLHRGNVHRQPQTEATLQIETSKEETQSRDQGQDPLSRDSNSQDHEEQQSAPPARSTMDPSSSMLMTDADGQRWTCTIPSAQVREVEPEAEKTTQEIEEEERQSVKRGLDLLEHLSNRCLRTNYGYWTYEYCHKKRIRQYHAADDIKWEPMSEQLTNILAVYQPPPAEIQGQPNIDGLIQQQSPVSPQEKIPTSTELGVSNERKYLVQHWDYGKICEITGAHRKVEVQFQCANVDERIQLVNEPSTCNYIMVIYSSSLCKDVAFELIPAPEANKIDCRRVVTDEQYQHRKVAVPEAIEGGIGSSAFQESPGQIKFSQQPEKESVANSKLLSGYKEMAALIDQVEAATKHKQLDEVLAEFDTYFEFLKPFLTEAQRDALQKVEDFVDGKASQLEPFGIDGNGQPLEMDSLLETLFGAASGSDGVKEQRKDAESEGRVQQESKAVHEKKDNQEVFQMILDALAENDNNKAAQDAANKDSGNKNAQPKTEKDDVVSSIDLASLLEILDATRRAGTAPGSADGDDKDEIKKKDGDK